MKQKKPELLTLDEVVAMTGLSPAKIYQLVARGEFPKPIQVEHHPVRRGATLARRVRKRRGLKVHAPPEANPMTTTIRMQITVDGVTYPIYRDVANRHPDAVHRAMGTASEDELQRALDTMHVCDWYAADGSYRGPDVNGLEMFVDSAT
jgi:hypothetical protein